jgi:Flp pilus assembly protein TadG
MQFSNLPRERFRSATRASSRGAAMAEFVVAIVPIMIAFFSFTQLGYVYTAHLAMKHAALVAAREGSLSLEPQHNPGAKGGEGAAIAAANAAIGSLSGALTLSTRVTGSGSRNGTVTATVSGTYKCSVPLGSRVVCGFGGVTTFKDYTVSLPLQGAEYKESK